MEPLSTLGPLSRGFWYVAVARYPRDIQHAATVLWAGTDCRKTRVRGARGKKGRA
jgi:hypothetical protein